MSIDGKLKHSDVTLLDGTPVTPQEAIKMRNDNPDAKFWSNNYAEFVNPVRPSRRPHDSVVRETQAHYRGLSESASGSGKKKKEALGKLERILESTGDFHELNKGLVEFRNQNNELLYDVPSHDWDHGFAVLHGKHKDGKEYAFVVLDGTTPSGPYFQFLNSMGDRTQYLEDRSVPNIKKTLVTDGRKKELGKDVYTSTVLIKDAYFAENKRPGHEDGHMMMGDVLNQVISRLYDDELVFLDTKEEKLYKVTAPAGDHSCDYSKNRARMKGGAPGQYCRKFEMEEMTSPEIVTHDINKNALRSQLGQHNHLYLAKIRQSAAKQMRLF